MNDHRAGIKEECVYLWGWEQRLTRHENEEAFQIWNDDYAVFLDRGLDYIDVYIYQNSSTDIVKIVRFSMHEIYLKENIK